MVQTIHKVGLFKDQESAKILCPQFFKDHGYKPFFRIEHGMEDDNRIMLCVSYDYWFSKHVQPLIDEDCRNEALAKTKSTGSIKKK